MDNINLKGMHLAYSAVYNQELREEFEGINEDFLGVDYLTEETLEDISEEVIYEMLDEGYNLNDIERIFEEFILEARVTYGHNTDRPPARVTYSDNAERTPSRIDKIKGAFKDVLGRVRGAVVQSQGKAKDSAIQASERASARGAAIKGSIGGLKDKLKDKITRAGQRVSSSAQRALKSAKQQSHIGLAKYASGRGLMPGAGLKTQSSAGRGQLRTAVAKDVASRAQGKITRAGQRISDTASSVKSGVKKNIRGVALNVARRMKEEVEEWVNDLLDEGYDLSDYTWDEMVDIYEERVNLYQPRSSTYQRPSGRNSPAQQALNKMVELKRKEPGSAREKRQTRATRRMGAYGSDMLGAKQDRDRRAQNESYDLYDVILSHLLDEGFADTLEGAEAIMVNMSEDWKESIVEENGGGPKSTKMPLSRERNIGRHDDWKDKPLEWGERPVAARKLKSRLNAVVGTQRRQDVETGLRKSYY